MAVGIKRTAVRLALVVAAAGAAPHPATACSLTGQRGVRRPGESHFVAVPSDRTVSAARGLPSELAALPAFPTRDQQVSAPTQGWWWRARLERWAERVRRGAPPYGQVVRLERVGGPDSLRVADALARSGGEAVLVPWELTSTCGSARNTSAAPRLPPGARVFLTARLRAAAGWVGGRPTFDVSPFDFPYAEHTIFREPAPRLTLTEFWTLYEALPAYRDLERDTAQALAPLRAWMRAHPDLAGRTPAPRELETAESYARALGEQRTRRRSR